MAMASGDADSSSTIAMLSGAAAESSASCTVDSAAESSASCTVDSADSGPSTISSPFSRRAINKTFTFDWDAGSCVLVFSSESSDVADHVDGAEAVSPRHATLSLAVRHTAEVVGRDRPGAMVERFQIADPLHSNWSGPVPSLALGAGAGLGWPWLQIFPLFACLRHVPPGAAAFLRANILQQGYDAVQKALFLDHCTLRIDLDVEVVIHVTGEDLVNLDEVRDQLAADGFVFGKDGISRAAIERHVRVLALGGEGPGETCTVCLDMVERGADGGWMPCGHVFHPNCIRGWLEKSNKCPVCRFEVQEI